MTAELGLTFRLAGERTKLLVGTQDPPWRVIRAFALPAGGSLVHLHNVSGGILGGDRLALNVDVGAGAAVQLTSTGATRVYRRRTDAGCSTQHTSINVASNGLLEYLPDPLIPFAGSRHSQRTFVNLADSATFFWWEVLSPGRQAMGEEFAFESLHVETRVQSTQCPLLLENFRLEPHERPVRSNAGYGPYSHLASFYAIQVGRSPLHFRELETMLSQVALEESRTGTIWGASALASDGIAVRGLSTTARHIPASLVRFWTVARRFLTGVDAVPPRKMK